MRQLVNQRKYLSALGVASVDENQRRHVVCQGKPSKLVDVERPIGAIAHHPIDSDGYTAPLNGVLKSTQCLIIRSQMNRPIIFQSKPTVQLPRKLARAVYGTGALKRAYDTDPFVSLAKKEITHPRLTPHHQFNGIVQAWRRLLNAGIFKCSKVRNLKGIIGEMLTKELEKLNVEFLRQRFQLVHRGLPASIKPFVELWKRPMQPLVCQAASLSRPRYHILI